MSSGFVIPQDDEMPPDELELSLNREIDKAVRREPISPKKKESRYHEEDVSTLAKRIQRCCDEIRAVIPLVVPPQTMAAGAPESPEQDERVGGAARDLLVYEAEVLMDLVDALVDKE